MTVTDFWNAAAIDDARTAVWGEADCDWDARADVHADIIAAWLPGATRVVEWGCGVGRLAWRVAERLDAFVLGIDVSEQMLTRAHPHDQVAYMLGDGETWNVEPASANGAYSMLVAQHLEPEVVVANLSEMRRVLVPGGRWVMQYVRGTNRSPHLHDYTNDEMRSLAKAAGLTVTNLHSGLFYPQWSWIGGSR